MLLFSKFLTANIKSYWIYQNFWNQFNQFSSYWLLRSPDLHRTPVKGGKILPAAFQTIKNPRKQRNVSAYRKESISLTFFKSF